MEDLLITASELRGLLVSVARKGFAKGSADKGERKLSSVLETIDVVVDGLIKTNKK